MPQSSKYRAKSREEKEEFFNRIEKILKKKLRISGGNRIMSTTAKPFPNQYGYMFGKTYRDLYNQNVNAGPANRTHRTKEYDLMDSTSPLCAVALDIYAANATIPDPSNSNHVLKVFTEDEEVKGELEELFYSNLNVDMNLQNWCRDLCKYGDYFLLLDIDEEGGNGVVAANEIPVLEIERVELYDPESKRLAVEFYWNLFTGATFTIGMRPQSQQGRKINFLEIAHFRLLSGNTFNPYGRCISLDSYIETEFGSKQIQNLTTEDKVWVFNSQSNKFELSNILKSVNTGSKKSYKVQTRHNYIEANETHPVLVFDTNTKRPLYKQVNELTVGDLVYIMKESPSNTNKKDIAIKKNLVGFNKNGWKNNVDKIPDAINGTFARLFGFMLGDGLTQNNNTVRFADGVYAKQNEEYCNVISSYAGKQVRHFDSWKNASNYGSYEFGSKMFTTILKENGFVGTAHTKRVPQWAFDASPEIQMEFIRGFVDADGSTSVDKWNCTRYQIEICNKDLLQDLKHIIDMNGIKCSTISKRTRDKKSIGHFIIKTDTTTSYYMYFYLDAPKQIQKVSYDLIDSDDVSLEPITAIEEGDSCIMYDIQVESTHSNFIANGMVVHNSVYEAGRTYWRNLKMMEDAMLVYRIVRAPERRVFKIEVGNIPEEKVGMYVSQVMSDIKRQNIVDPDTGDINQQFNVWNQLEDYVLPVRNGMSSAIDTLPGAQHLNDIEDVEYVKSILLAALRIPKAYLTFDEALQTRATLSMEDARFSSIIQRIQKYMVSELYKIAAIHLAAKGYKVEDIDFDLILTAPSTSEEDARLDLLGKRMELFRTSQDAKILSSDTAKKDILKMTDQEISLDKVKQIENAEFMYGITQVTAGQRFDNVMRVFSTPADVMPTPPPIGTGVPSAEMFGGGGGGMSFGGGGGMGMGGMGGGEFGGIGGGDVGFGEQPIGMGGAQGEAGFGEVPAGTPPMGAENPVGGQQAIGGAQLPIGTQATPTTPIGAVGAPGAPGAELGGTEAGGTVTAGIDVFAGNNDNLIPRKKDRELIKTRKDYVDNVIEHSSIAASKFDEKKVDRLITKLQNKVWQTTHKK